ncbi:MAG: hypothetical protein L0227_00715 [Chloroflexi bacterium]|nr:hypothetical protein [Chloroflexota bacterium]
MTAYIVEEGEVRAYDLAYLPPRDTYGMDWIYVEAADEAAALAKAETYDATRGGLVEERLFAVGYRAGAFGLPDDVLVSMTEVAERLGTTAGTVRSWRVRHRDFPAASTTLAIGPVWWWSDIARWAARKRRPGRPRKR